VGADYLLFTSTMMVYGPTEVPKDEDALLEPVNAYAAARKSLPRATAIPMANGPPFATLNHFAADLGLPSESESPRIGIR
jgi:UDP-glucose 4-epimerase